MTTLMSLNSALVILIVNSLEKEDIFLPYGLVNDVLILMATDAFLSPFLQYIAPMY